MYRSAGHAVWAMVRWRESLRAAKAAPFPDHKPKGASTADKWRYIHVSPTRGSVRPEPEDGRDPETVMVLFDRLNRRRYLTRLFIHGIRIRDLRPWDRRDAAAAKARFIHELCVRSLIPPPCEDGNPRFRQCANAKKK